MLFDFLVSRVQDCTYVLAVFVLSLELSSCAGVSPTVYTAREVLPLAAGQAWDMQDQDGNVTHFQVLGRPVYQACQTGTFLDVYITKAARSAYWIPGVPGAWDNFILKSDQGSWRGVTEFAGFQAEPSTMTTQKNEIAGKPLPYFLLPPNMTISDGDILETDTDYLPIVVWDKDLSMCALLSDATPGSWGGPVGTPVHWHTVTSIEEVSTPAYTGKAVKTVYCETPAGGVCTNETWFFAPQIGIVQISFPPQTGLPNGYTTRRVAFP